MNKTTKRSKMDVFIHLIVKIKRDDIFALASQLAYYLILSFFPFLMFILTLVGLSDLNQNDVLEGLSTIVPTSVFELTKNTVIEVLGYQNTGLLGISLLLVMWTASSAFRAVIKAINKAYNIEEHRSYIKRAMISLVSTIALAITVLLALALLVFGNVLGEYIISIVPFKEIMRFIWNLLRYGIIIFVLIFVFAAIYRYTPSIKLKWREVLPGAIITTIGWIIVSLGFSFYINNYSNYSKFYGSLAGVFILMIWLFLSSMIIMLGVEVNSVLLINKKRK